MDAKSDASDGLGGSLQDASVASWAEIGAAIKQGTYPAEEYFEKVVREVHSKLPVALKSLSAIGGFTFKGTLQEQEPLQVDGKGQLQTVREHWRWSNCESSLAKKGMYEAPGSLFWLSPGIPVWDGQPLAASSLSYSQIVAGRDMWSLASFERSSDDPKKRRYLVNGVIPTALHVNMGDVTVKADALKKNFTNLPVLGSRAVVAGWYSQMLDALREPAFGGQVTKLFEAALSLPIRVRNGATRKQVVLDSLSYSEELFAHKAGHSDSFFDFAEKFADLIGKANLDKMSVKAISTAAAKLNVTFHGAEINDSCGRCLQTMSPYLQLPGVRAAIKAFEDTSAALNQQSIISQLMHTASKSYGMGTPAAVGAVECLVYCLKAGLVHGDIARENQLTKEFLFGDRKRQGLPSPSSSGSRL